MTKTRWRRRSLVGSRILVTGASGALGSATVQELRRRGALVIGLNRTPGPAMVSCDVTDDEQVATAVKSAIEQLGGLDAVVTFAGIGMPVDIGAAPGENVLRTIDVGLLGAWRVISAALPALLESRGRVVICSSALAYLTVPFAGAYAVTKRALAAYADTLRLEYGTRIGVTTLYPGFVDTPIHDASRQVGVSLDGMVPGESGRHTVTAVVRSLTTARAAHDRGTTFWSVGARLVGRHASWVTHVVTERILDFHSRRGHFDAEIARGLRDRRLEH